MLKEYLKKTKSVTQKDHVKIFVTLSRYGTYICNV